MPDAPASLDGLATLLFVPADRPERIAKAIASGADAVIIDLQGAVVPHARETARTALYRYPRPSNGSGVPLILRISAVGTPDHESDVAVAQALPIAGVMLAKSENPVAIRNLANRIGLPVVALIETARGIVAARSIAEISARLAFGSIDYALHLGSAHERDALQTPRSELVLASRLSRLAGPIDGVTTAIHDEATVREDAAYAARLGFRGKLLIHPAQIAPASEALRPTEVDTVWAGRIIDVLAQHEGDGAVMIDGDMVDAPVIACARQILHRASSVRTVAST